MRYCRSCRGFTLVEVAVVLVIVGLLLGGFIGSLSSRIEVARYTETMDDLESIKQAIIGYAYKNGVLPCPDADADGISETSCSTGPAGNVPWVTLGLGSGDAWNNRFEYWLDADRFSVPFALSTNAIGAVNTRSPDGSTLLQYANGVVVVVFSRGKNGFGAVGADGASRVAIPATGHSDEDNNGDGNQEFVSRLPTHEGATTAGGVFDDIVVWISEFELKAKMVKVGRLP